MTMSLMRSKDYPFCACVVHLWQRNDWLISCLFRFEAIFRHERHVHIGSLDFHIKVPGYFLKYIFKLSPHIKWKFFGQF